MSKILFVGDVHLSPRTPQSRRDDYPQTLLNKLDSLLQLSKDNSVSDIFFLGDMFNSKHMTLSYFTKCFQKLKQFTDDNINLYTVIGNHDILYNSESTMNESPLQILFDSGILSNQEKVQIDNVTVYQYNYLTKLENIPQCERLNTDFHVMTGHYFYNLGFNDDEHTMSPELCKHLQFNTYILGHDHTPYKPLKLNDYSVYRPGSLSRGTSHTCQLTRDKIQVVIMDSNTCDTNYIDLPDILPTSEVYKELSSMSTETTLSESLKDFLQALDFNNSSDIFETLNSIPMEDNIKELIISYLNSEGLYNKSGGV